MAVTYASIAKASGVSTAAVSLVLRNPDHPEFSPETRRRILNAAKRLNYTPNRVAASLRGGQTKTLGLVIPYNEVELMDAAERTASDLGYTIMIQFTQKPDLDLERKAVFAALEHRVDGLIWQPSQPTRAYGGLVTRLAGLQSPIVFLGHRLRCLRQADWIYCDVRPEMGAAVDLLRRGGYQRFAYLCPDDFHVARRWRLQMFRRHLGQPFDLITYPRDGSPRQLIRERLRALLEPGLPLGIVSDLDWGAVHVIEACRELQVRVPEQLGVIGINDSLVGGSFHIGEVTVPQITAVRRPLGELARKAVTLLVERIKGSRTGPGETHALPAAFIPRGSTLPVISAAPTHPVGVDHPVASQPG